MTLGNCLWSFFSIWIFSIINFLTKLFYARVGMGALGLRSDMDSRSTKGRRVDRKCTQRRVFHLGKR